ncbi:hypothetical protein BF49_4808 [Bradyrhizobium sp.]|nr:hypothetical protein BF49_4808 [Bradyrhizobium sp.]
MNGGSDGTRRAHIDLLTPHPRQHAVADRTAMQPAVRLLPMRAIASLSLL